MEACESCGEKLGEYEDDICDTCRINSLKTSTNKSAQMMANIFIQQKIQKKQERLKGKLLRDLDNEKLRNKTELSQAVTNRIRQLKKEIIENRELPDLEEFGGSGLSLKKMLKKRSFKKKRFCSTFRKSGISFKKREQKRSFKKREQKRSVSFKKSRRKSRRKYN
jgi:hypothetical protein